MPHALPALFGATGAVSAGIYLAAFAVYFVPTIVALARRGAANTGAIALVNFLLGWSVIGWIVALTMALRTRSQYRLPPGWMAPQPRPEWVPPQHQQGQRPPPAR